MNLTPVQVTLHSHIISNNSHLLSREFLSIMVWKTVDNSDPGDADHFGGDDGDKISELFSGINVDDVEINSDWTFNSGRMRVHNPGQTFSYQIVAAAISANRILNLPLITGTDTIAVLGLSQTFGNPQTIAKDTSSPLLTLYRDTIFTTNSGVGMQLDGKNSAGTRTNFGDIYIYTEDATAGDENTAFAVDGLYNGAPQSILYVGPDSMGFGRTQVNFSDSGLSQDSLYTFPNIASTKLAGVGLDNNFSAAQTIKLNTEGSSNNDILNIHRDTSTTGKTWELNFNAKDSANNTQAYAALRAEIVDSTTTTEDGALHFLTTKAGAEKTNASVMDNGKFRCGGENTRVQLDETDLTTRRNYTFPDADTKLAGIGVSQTFSGVNTFDNYVDIKAIAEPATPPAGYARKWLDSTLNKFCIKHDDGSVVVLE